jgi:hypothetical protein
MICRQNCATASRFEIKVHGLRFSEHSPTMPNVLKWRFLAGASDRGMIFCPRCALLGGPDPNGGT